MSVTVRVTLGLSVFQRDIDNHDGALEFLWTGAIVAVVTAATLTDSVRGTGPRAEADDQQ